MGLGEKLSHLRRGLDFFRLFLTEIYVNDLDECNVFVSYTDPN